MNGTGRGEGGPRGELRRGAGHPRRRTVILIALGAAVVAAIGALLILAQFADIIPGLSTGAVRHRINAAGPWGPLLFLVLLIGAVVFAPIPNTPFFIAAGLIWGWWPGSLLSMLGMAIGSVFAFVLAQRLTRGALRRVVGPSTLERIEPMARTLGPWAVFWARLLPVTNFDWINYLAGLTPMRLAPFTIATVLGILPSTVATVVAGAAIEHRPVVTVAITGGWLAALVLSSIYVSRRRGGRAR